MTRRTRIVHLALFLAALWGLNYAISGTAAIPAGDSAIWFHAGLLTLIIGVYWIEHYFTKPADVVVNSLIVFIAASALNDPPLSQWWAGIRYGTLLLAVSAFLVIWAGSPAVPEHDNSWWKRRNR